MWQKCWNSKVSKNFNDCYKLKKNYRINNFSPLGAQNAILRTCSIRIKNIVRDSFQKLQAISSRASLLVEIIHFTIIQSNSVLFRHSVRKTRFYARVRKARLNAQNEILRTSSQNAILRSEKFLFPLFPWRKIISFATRLKKMAISTGAVIAQAVNLAPGWDNSVFNLVAWDNIISIFYY